MNQQNQFSIVTKEYLDAFHCILDNMIQGMTEAELSDSISHNFIVQMIPHHQAAIEMSENLLKYTTNIPLQEIALQIVKEQTASIENMKEIESCCSDMENGAEEVCQYQERMGQIMETMFTAMRNAPAVNDINCNFIWEMIPHHKGAVEMSELTLRYPICPELIPVLQAIITSQKRGIMQMQRLMQRMSCGSGRRRTGLFW
ncbi:MAG: DUF305 domain-containing protein [Lachnospiraceae bacterium]|nr:DUF305 domain-containing protein [Lachnospiraceae bacterium]